jgi:ribosome maturation factor RimP
MDFSKIILKLLEEALEGSPNLFLIDLKIGVNNDVKIILDSDNEVPLKDCIKISRAIEYQIDREVYDFSLEVSSAGVGSTLKKTRQYIKNIGRNLEVIINDSSIIKGKLTNANENDFTLEWKQKEPKPIGKGKIMVIKNKTLYYNEIVSSKVVV